MTHPHMAVPGRTGGRALAPWLALIVAFVALGLLASTGSGGTALDPGGNGPQGAKALALLLRAYGAEVTVTADPPVAPATIALALTDQLDDARRTATADWVRLGGTLVVADPTSALQPGVPVRSGRGLSTTADLRPVGPCALAGLGTIRRLEAGPSLLLRAPTGTRRSTCFAASSGPADASFLVAAGFGHGAVVGLGGAGLWTNERLGRADNAALAIALLAPQPGTHIAILIPSRAGSGGRSGLKLVGARVREALVQLLVAFGVLAWWKGRRLGDPVPEERLVEVPAAELVGAVGHLLARTSSRDAAAHALREAARRGMGERLGLGAGATAQQVADVAAVRLGLDARAVLAQLEDTPVPDDAALVALAVALAELRQEAIRGRTP
ncbi:MAG: DUF4350 domain-containing protein [Acidimicrobiales bacterium]